MTDTASLLWGTLFGAVGLGFFIYGKRQKAPVPLFSGVALFVVPYLISNPYVLVPVGIALAVLPYLVRL